MLLVSGNEIEKLSPDAGGGFNSAVRGNSSGVRMSIATAKTRNDSLDVIRTLLTVLQPNIVRLEVGTAHRYDVNETNQVSIIG